MTPFGVIVAAFIVLAAATTPQPSAPAPRVRVEPLATFDSHVLPERGAWSPKGTRLAMLEAYADAYPSRVTVVDASDPNTGPRTAYEARQWVRSFGWSPDGEWLLVLFGDPSPDNRRWLVATPWSGADAETLLAGVDVTNAAWGPDGRIHCRARPPKGGPMRWRVLPPPAGWKPAASFAPRDVWVAEAGSRSDLRLSRFAQQERGWPMLLGMPGDPREEVRLLDGLPDGSRSLVVVNGSMRSGTVQVVDDRGRSLLDLERTRIRFIATALSADGGLIVGFAGEQKGEADWSRTWLEAADGRGLWSTPVDGGEGGREPQLSREDTYVAYALGRGTRIARLLVERP